MSQPPQDDGTPPPDRTREVRLPPVPPKPPADQPTDRMPGAPLGQRDPTLRIGGGAQPPATGGQPAASPPWAQPGQPPAGPGWGGPPYGPQGQGGPGQGYYGGPGYGPPSGYGGPGYGAPGQGGYGPPGHGGPGYGGPPPQRRKRGPLIAVLVALGVLLLAGGVLLTVLLTRDDGGGDTGIAGPTSTSSTPTSASSTSSAPTTSGSPSTSPGGGFGGGAGSPSPGGGGGALNVPESPQFAAGWVQSLVDGDAGAAYDDLCADGLAQFADPAALQADFEAFVGGLITEGSATDAVAAGDVDEVTFDVTLDSGATRSFVVTVAEEGGRPTVCGFIGA